MNKNTNKPLKFLVSHINNFNIVYDKVNLKVNELQITSNNIISNILTKLYESLIIKAYWMKKDKFKIIEFPLLNNQITDEKLNYLKSFTLQMLILQVLLKELIIEEKRCKPFWNTTCKNNSKKSWLPVKNNNTETVLNSSSTLFLPMELNSQSLITKVANPITNNLETISLQSSMYSVANKWEEGNIVQRSLKVQIFPTKEQKQILNQWIGTYRFVYNRAVAYSKLPSCHNLSFMFDPYHFLNFYTMRNHFVTKSVNKLENDHLNDWEFKTPKDIRGDAIKTFTTSYLTNLKQLKKHNITEFNMRFKSKKKPVQTIGGIAKSAIKKVENGFKIYSSKEYTNNTIFKIKPKGKKLKARLKNLKIENDCELTYDGMKYFLLIPYKKTVKEIKEKKKVVALDPGVRTFQTGYSNDTVFKVDSKKKQIQKLYTKIDFLKSLRKKKYRKKILKCQKKIRNHVDQIHYQTIKYLKNYNDVLLPEFKSQEMVKSKTLHKSVIRSINSLQHYQFKQRLLNTASEIKNFRVHIVNEAYTSKTCSCCGNLKEIKGNKIYNCNNCNAIMDRDINGARNIYLKHLQ
jgi:transposase